MTWDIPLSRVELAGDDVAAVVDCFRAGWLSMGPRTQAFESAFSGATGLGPAVAVSSGTSGLRLVLEAAGIGDGDAVVVPDLAGPSSLIAIRETGARPVVLPGRRDHPAALDADAVAAVLAPGVRAILAVHRFGVAVPLGEIAALCADHGVLLVEDARDAAGADGIGGGAAQVHSLGPGRQLEVGQGGVVTSRDEELLGRCRSLRSHGLTSGTWDRHRGHADSYDVTAAGWNFRLDEPRATLAARLLERLPQAVERRRQLVRHYRRELSDFSAVRAPWAEEDERHASPIACAVALPDRSVRTRVADELGRRSIQTASPALAGPDPDGTCLLLLPVWETMPAETVTRVCAAVRTALA